MEKIQAHVKYPQRFSMWIAPGAIFCLALAVRLVYNLTAARYYVALFDAGTYERIALHLLSERCFCDASYVPTLERGPVWPIVIAAMYFLFGPQNQNVRFLLSFVGAGTCALLYYFARDLFGAKHYGLLAGGIGALYPGMFVYDGWLYSESLYTFLFLLYVYLLYRFQRTLQRRWMIGGGIALGLALLTRTNEIIALGMLVSWPLIAGCYKIVSRRVAFYAGVGIVLVTVVVIFPWSLRNYAVSHKIVPITTGGNVVLVGAYNDTVFGNSMLGNVGMWVTPQLVRPAIVYRSPCCDIWGERPEQREAAVRWITTNPKLVVRLLRLHFINIWQSGTPDGVLPIDQAPPQLSSSIIKDLMQSVPPIIFLFAGFGLLAAWRTKWRELLPVVLAIGWTIVQCVLLYGSIRFRAPIEPMLVLLATGAFYWGWSGGTKRVEEKR